jgi:hypothetical protein
MNIIRYDGTEITQKGIYSGVPIDVYHNDPELFENGAFSISSTGLKRFIERPLAYWAQSPFNPKREPQKETEALEFGRAAHMLLLGEGGFAERYRLRPAELNGKPWQGNRTDCKEWLKAVKSEGKSVITAEQIDTLRRMAEALSRHPMHLNGQTRGLVEHSGFAKIDDIWLRIRPDLIPTDSGDYVDIKTAEDMSYEGLSRAIFNFGYHIQGALVRKVIRSIIGPDAFTSFTLLFIEKSSPYDVRAFQLKDNALDLGEQQIDHALRDLKRCIETATWPGYDGWSSDIGWIELPGWAASRIEEGIKYGRP